MDLNERAMDQHGRCEGRWYCVELFVNMKSKSIVRDPGGLYSCASKFDCFELSHTYQRLYDRAKDRKTHAADPYNTRLV